MSGRTLNRIAGLIFAVVGGVGVYLLWEWIISEDSIYPEIAGGMFVVLGLVAAVSPSYGDPL
jgi:hypothetical protein